MSRVEVLVWDYREQPDLAKLAAVVLEMSRAGEVYLTSVDDTGGADYALLVSDRPLEQIDARDVYLRWFDTGQATL